MEDSLGREIGDTAIPLMMIYLVGFLLAPLWVWISSKIGNKKAFIAAMTLNIIGFFLLFFVTSLSSVILVFTFQGIGFSATSGVIYGLLRAEGIIMQLLILENEKKEVSRVFGNFLPHFHTSSRPSYLP